MSTMMNQMGGERGRAAKDILAQKVEAGMASAGSAIEQIIAEVPQDSIVRSTALTFDAQRGAHGVKVHFGTTTDPYRPIHPYALGQLAARAGVPTEYMRELVNSSEDWKRELASSILTEHFHKGCPQQRHLVRTVKGTAKAFLSDKYRRLDSRPLVEAFVEECDKIDARPVDGLVTETRCSLKAIIPRVYEPTPGEAICFGVEWSNSDFGNGTHSIRAFILRLWCLNGATTENALREIHLGGRLADNIEFSNRTYELDTRTSVSALRDVVKGTLGEGGIRRQFNGIVAAQAETIDWRNLQAQLAKTLNKGEMKEAKDAFESNDVINLPAGATVWRASNALSWIAKKAEPERRLDLERAAGALVAKAVA